MSLDLQVSPVVGQELVNENNAAQQDGDTAHPQGRIAAGHEPSRPLAGMQERLDFALPLPEVETATSLSEPPALLLLDTSKISNPRVRELVDAAVARLDQSFDSMLARIVQTGVFVALTEFVGEHGDGASVVRALHESQLLASDGATGGRRVVIGSMEGADLRGVVLRASAFVGYADWTHRWQTQKAMTARHWSRIGSLMAEAGPQRRAGLQRGTWRPAGRGSVGARPCGTSSPTCPPEVVAASRRG